MTSVEFCRIKIDFGGKRTGVVINRVGPLGSVAGQGASYLGSYL